MPDPTKYVGLALGPLLFVLVWAWPLEALSPKAHLLAAVFAWTVTYWVTEALPVPVTAVFSSVLSIVLGVAPAKTVLASYGDPIIFLFIGSFIIAEAMRGSGLDRRFAFGLLRHPWATRSPGRILATVGAITCAISLWVSNTATTAMMLPVGLGILGGLGPAGDPARTRFPIGRFGRAEEVARVVRFLIETGSFITGAPIEYLKLGSTAVKADWYLKDWSLETIFPESMGSATYESLAVFPGW